MILMLEDNAERIEQFKAVLSAIDPSLELRVWRDAHRMIAEVGVFCLRRCLSPSITTSNQRSGPLTPETG